MVLESDVRKPLKSECIIRTHFLINFDSAYTALSFIDKIEQLDKDIFLYFNSHHNEFWDVVMETVSSRWSWLPLYALLLVMVIITYRKRWWLILICVAALIASSDQVSGIFKRSVGRYRPCHNLELQDVVHVVDGCGGKYGFVSSHAANTFALAMFLSLLLRRRRKYFPYFIFPWAILVSYSRIYIGVHYPADLAAGGLLGILLAIIIYYIWKYADRKLDEKELTSLR